MALDWIGEAEVIDERIAAVASTRSLEKECMMVRFFEY